MITVSFTKTSQLLTSFELKGHSGFAQSGSDIVCASVSSAAYMTANTLTEIIGLNADITVDEGFMQVKLTKENALKAQDILRGFELHITELSKQYPKNINVIYSEV